MMANTSEAEYGVVLFHSVSHAIRAEKLTEQAGLKIKLIPVPRQFSSNCGTALRFSWADESEMRQILRDKKMDVEAIHKLS